MNRYQVCPYCKGTKKTARPVFLNPTTFVWTEGKDAEFYACSHCGGEGLMKFDDPLIFVIMNASLSSYLCDGYGAMTFDDFKKAYKTAQSLEGVVVPISIAENYTNK